MDYLCFSKFKAKKRGVNLSPGLGTTSREGTVPYNSVTGKEPSVAIYDLRLCDLSLISDEIYEKRYISFINE